MANHPGMRVGPETKPVENHCFSGVFRKAAALEGKELVNVLEINAALPLSL